RVIAVLVAAALMGLLFVGTSSARAAWNQIAELLSLQGKPQPASPAILSEHEIEGLDRQSAQKQAELLLERSINHYDGANDRIATRVDGWRGNLKLTSQLNSQITTGMNSNDLRVRAAAIEVDLAALDQAKTPENVARLAQEAESGSQQQRVWALWTLGLLGNRGVEPQRVSEILISQLRDSNPEIRHWAVEGLAYLGTEDTIAPLLQTFHDDPSPMVRERAACSLAQSGMLNEQQRRSVVPKLLDYAEDASLDAQTHTWVYHALRDITGQNLPSDPAAWRNWYSTTQN
ncbi:MAG: HEAT repeat domain-containing protein, partial [Acidobacteriia bacterium]|nr:HEAT repeat domain-containing protein [Terriglobia bacterium]